MQKIQLQSPPNPESADPASGPSDVWVDLDVTDDAGRRWLADESGLSDEILERLLEPSAVTYWRRFGRGFHFNVHAGLPIPDSAAIGVIDFGIWLEPGRIITVRRSPVPMLDQAVVDCATDEGPSSAWELVVYALSEAMSGVEQNLHDLNAGIDHLEDAILNSEEESPIRRIAELQKRLVYARRFRLPLANMVSFISSQPRSVIDGDLRDDLEGVMHALAQNQEMLCLAIDRAAALQVQIRDQIADSMNAATYRFTWVATVFLPLGFLTGLLGINVAGIPGDHNPFAFWVVCGALCVIAGLWGVIVGRVTSPFTRKNQLIPRASDRRND
jgi:zinc transporter